MSASHGQVSTYSGPNTFLPWPAPTVYPSYWCPSADPSQPSLTPGHANTRIFIPFLPVVSPCQPNPHQANTTRFRPFPVDCPACPHLAPTALPAPLLPAQSLCNQRPCLPPPTCAITEQSTALPAPTYLHDQLSRLPHNPAQPTALPPHTHLRNGLLHAALHKVRVHMACDGACAVLLELWLLPQRIIQRSARLDDL